MHSSRSLGIALMMVLATSTAALAQKPKAGGAGKLIPAGYYECLLGAYSNNGKATPFVNLAIPNGSNILSDEVMTAIRGNIPLGEIGYVAKGYFFVPQKGTYEFDSSLGDVSINGRAMKFNRKPGTIDLDKGEYEIEIHEGNHGQPYLAKGKISIRLAGSPQLVPIYNRGKDIQRFLASAVEGVPVIPVSKIDFESALIDLKVPKR